MLEIKNLYFVFLLFFTSFTMAGDLRPFTSDGCSSFANGTFSNKSLWLHCCMQHDLVYWKGGSEIQKETADRELERCVAKVGEPQIAKLMLVGVKMGGTPHIDTSYRWGYGWPYGRGYKELNDSENQEVKMQLDKFKLVIDGVINQLSVQTNGDD